MAPTIRNRAFSENGIGCTPAAGEIGASRKIYSTFMTRVRRYNNNILGGFWLLLIYGFPPSSPRVCFAPPLPLTTRWAMGAPERQKLKNLQARKSSPPMYKHKQCKKSGESTTTAGRNYYHLEICTELNGHKLAVGREPVSPCRLSPCATPDWVTRCETGQSRSSSTGSEHL